MKRKALFITFAITIALCGCAEKKNTETNSNENRKADFAELISDTGKDNSSESKDEVTNTTSDDIPDDSSDNASSLAMAASTMAVRWDWSIT